jgi:16S rRNA (cytosine1402-N4)-methyltransferase
MSHVSVLLRETADPLVQIHGKTYVDATLGGGGHTAYLLAAKPEAKVYAFDRDAQMIAKAHTRFQAEIAAGRLVLVHDNYRHLKERLKEYGVECVDGVMADLGVSSFQLDLPERGFSFMRNGPLDMRMGEDAPFSAYDVVNEWDASELEKIFWKYGEEKFGRKIAQRIVEKRADGPIQDTAALAKIVSDAIPKHLQGKIHPATRVFQAIRIVVNQELEGLEKFLEAFPDILCPGGVLSVISFHSLEDRIVKERFKYLSADCICPPEILSCARCHKPPGRIVQNKPIVASDEEIAANPRSRSAKLRVFYKN